MAKFEKRYLGDGVYADVEDGMIKLTTSDGYRDTNTIFLELPVYDSLVEYVEYAKDVAKQERIG